MFQVFRVMQRLDLAIPPALLGRVHEVIEIGGPAMSVPDHSRRFDLLTITSPVPVGKFWAMHTFA